MSASSTATRPSSPRSRFSSTPASATAWWGANGSGKTTLLNMLSGDIETSEGAITVPQRLRLGVLQQDQFLYEDESILNVALMGNAALWEVTVAKERLLAASAEEFDADKFAQLEETFLHCDGYTAPSPGRHDFGGSRAAGSHSRRPALNAFWRFQAAGLARPGVGQCPGCAAARRADQPPRHPLDPLARNLPCATLPGRW